jgi:ABC-type antimicrobial peptide transport system permease subunit
MIYYPLDQGGVNAFAIVARTAGDPAALTASLRNAMREVMPSLPVTRLMPFDAHLGNALTGPRAAARLLGAFSLLALLLASLGVYAVVSFAVERRSQELGIRVALGAARSRLVRMVVGESLGVVSFGVVAGLWLAMLAVRGLDGMLFGVETVDFATFAGAAVLLLVTAGTASFLPALRATRADPVEVLRP